jgi:small subunit ribosomal protein S1
VKEVDAKGAVIELADGIEGYLSARDFSKDRIDDLSQHLKVGEQVEAKFTGMDRKGRMLALSIRAKDEDEMAETLSEYQNQHAERGTTKLGALLKEQLNKSE